MWHTMSNSCFVYYFDQVNTFTRAVVRTINPWVPYIKFPKFNVIPLVNKTYVIEVTLIRQKPPLKFF